MSWIGFPNAIALAFKRSWKSGTDSVVAGAPSGVAGSEGGCSASTGILAWINSIGGAQIITLAFLVERLWMCSRNVSTAFSTALAALPSFSLRKTVGEMLL